MAYHLVSRCVIPAPLDFQHVYRCPKRTLIIISCFKNFILQFYKCYLENYAIWMLLECFIKKRKSTHISGNKPGIDPLRSVASGTLFYPISIMLQIYIKDSGNLKHSKIVKTIINTTGSHPFNCPVKLRPATV